MPETHVKEILSELGQNLRWIWNGEFDALFREIDKYLWSHVNHNPTRFLQEVDDEKINAKVRDEHYRVRLERARMSLRSYLKGERHWGNYNAPGLSSQTVAYFSAEFGLHESLPIYSGGLGVLAGDHLKSSSDLGLPLWGVSILYREGYFFQHFDAKGNQTEEYTELDLSKFPIERLLDKEGKGVTLEVHLGPSALSIELWRLRVGRAHLLLLDGYGGPSPDDRYAFTRRLYGGDLTTRLCQELILGVGGYRALRKIGVRPGVIHMNEGHSAFAVLAAIAERMKEEGLSFEEAAERVRGRTVFTTHTPVEAGHDRFPPELIKQYLTPLREELGLSEDQFLSLGRTNPSSSQEPFCMTVLALKMAQMSNGVSALHGKVSRKMWQSLWPNRTVDRVPIGHVTNGVHVPSWIAPQMAKFLDRKLGTEWLDHLCRVQMWEELLNIDPFELWDVKCSMKNKLLSFAEKRIRRRNERLGSEAQPAELNQNALTIGFARRMVAYKRASLIFRDLDRLARLASVPGKPIQFIFAGKAHPHDEIGKGVLRELYAYTQDERFRGKVFLLENYDMNVARHLVQGCDLWLNNPRRPLEACGTSGQKAVFNATLNFAVLDGWWAEAWDRQNGYAFGDGLTHTDLEKQDERDGRTLLDVLEYEVIPDYFTRSQEGVPLKWVERILRAFATLGARYNSDRMVMDYTRHCYLATAGTVTSDFPLGE